MKKTLLIFASILLANIANGQAPQKFNYQAVALNSSGVEIVNQPIGIRISILDLTPNGTVIYQETQTPTTNQFGLFTLEVGGGTVVTGTFAGIDWNNGSKYLKTEIDPAGGFNYSIAGVSQLLSVPYALNAANGQFKHYVGELYGGGVVFHVYRDATGNEHGLIVGLADLSTSSVWSNIDNLAIGATAQSSWDGAANSQAIISQPGHTTSAAALCATNASGGFTDWYLPATQELNLLWNNLYAVNKTLDTDGNSSSTAIARQYYWSSTENNTPNGAISFDFNIGSITVGHKSLSPQAVRAIRAY